MTSTDAVWFIAWRMWRMWRCRVSLLAIPGYSSFPFCVQVCLFSATMAPEILDMTSKFMRNAVRILVKKDGHCHFASLFHCAWTGSCQHLPTFWSSFLSFLILDPSPLSVCQDELTLEGIRQFYVAIETPGELSVHIFVDGDLDFAVQVHPGSSDAVWECMRCQAEERGMESGHSLWPLRDIDHHSSHHLL